MKKLNKFIIILLTALLVGATASVLELYFGHAFILEPLLANDYNFIKETYFAPTYYGLIKMFVVFIAFFAVYYFFRKIKINKNLIVGILGTLLFGIYYYFIRPAPTAFSIISISIVHFIFIFISSWVGEKYLKFIYKNT